MKVCDFVNGISNFNSPILIEYFELNNSEPITIAKDVNRKILLRFFGEVEIFSVEARHNYIVLTLIVD
jgi:hypothetical protein